MMKIDSNYSMSHKNGYFVTHKIAIKGDKSKLAGESHVSETKTYVDLIGAWIALKEKGVDGTAILATGEKLIVEAQKKAGAWVMAQRAKAAKKLQGSES